LQVKGLKPFVPKVGADGVKVGVEAHADVWVREHCCEEWRVAARGERLITRLN